MMMIRTERRLPQKLDQWGETKFNSDVSITHLPPSSYWPAQQPEVLR